MNYMDRYNSRKPASEQTEKKEHKLKPIVKGKTSLTNKHGFVGSIMQSIFNTGEELKNHIISDVIIPGIQDSMYNIGIDMLSAVFKNGSSSNNRREPYSKYYISNGTLERKNNRPNNTSRVIANDISFETKGDAEAVLASMCEAIDNFDCVRVTDMYDLANIKADVDYTLTNYGWTDLSKAYVERIKNRYYIRLPKAKQLF